MSYLRLALAFILINSTALSAVEFSKGKLKNYLETITKHPHPMGSPAQKDMQKFIAATMKSIGYQIKIQNFTAKTPNRNYPPLTKNLEGANILAYEKTKSQCYNILASHYDTKKMKNFVGANDPASSVAGLLLLASKLKGKKAKNGCSFLYVFFDGEEATLDGWTDSERFHPSGIVDNTYGSRYMAKNLEPCHKSYYCEPYYSKKIENFILLDMIGAKNIQLSLDGNSSFSLRRKAKSIDLNYCQGQLYKNSYLTGIADDHIAFCRLGIPCLNIIDFNHLENWHKSSDTLENIDLTSIQRVLRLTYYLSLDL